MISSLILGIALLGQCGTSSCSTQVMIVPTPQVMVIEPQPQIMIMRPALFVQRPILFIQQPVMKVKIKMKKSFRLFKGGCN